MTELPRQTLQSLADALASGVTTSRALVEQSLARIADPMGEGARAFLIVNTASALAEADRQDKFRKAGEAASPYAGMPCVLG